MYLKTTLPDETTIVLRTPTEGDIPHLFEAAVASHKELAQWMPWCRADYRLADTETWVRDTVASDSEHSFVIWDETENLCLGTCGLNDINTKHRCANLGYWVRSSHIGRGIASSATLKVAQFAFDQLELVRVEIVVAVGNGASQRVAEKVQATREGIIRNGLVHGEKSLDAWMFSLIPADFLGE
ncbi:MAG: GNAT family N-acetyltransferase [Planctomycetes bacterium]|nr:GNAT family N-acetyltransferase [Planctomycetota bacterium]